MHHGTMNSKKYGFNPGRRAWTFVCAAAVSFAMQTSAATQNVEIQIALCGEPGAIEAALDLRPRSAPIEVWLFDDTSLAMFAAGLRLRLRGDGTGSELTLKCANQDCARLPAGVVPKKQGKCEYDLHGETMAGAMSSPETRQRGYAGFARRATGAGRRVEPRADTLPARRGRSVALAGRRSPAGSHQAAAISQYGRALRCRRFDVAGRRAFGRDFTKGGTAGGGANTRATRSGSGARRCRGVCRSVRAGAAKLARAAGQFTGLIPGTTHRIYVRRPANVHASATIATAVMPLAICATRPTRRMSKPAAMAPAGQSRWPIPSAWATMSVFSPSIPANASRRDSPRISAQGCAANRRSGSSRGATRTHRRCQSLANVAVDAPIEREIGCLHGCIERIAERAAHEHQQPAEPPNRDAGRRTDRTPRRTASCPSGVRDPHAASAP